MKLSLMKLLALAAMLSFTATGLRAQTTQTTPAAPAKVEAAKPAPAAPVAPAKVEAAKPVVAAPAAVAKPEVAPVAPAAPAPAKAEVKKAAVAAPAKVEAKKAAVAAPAKAEVKKAEAKPAAAKKAAPRKARKAAPKLTAAQLAAQKAAFAAAAAKAPAWSSFPRDANWVKRHEGFVAQARKGNVDILFLGDSITDGWNRQTELWQKHYAPLHAANFGIGGDRTESVIYRITNGELSGIKPKVIMMLIGTNNTSKGDSPEDITRGIAQILRIIQVRLPQTKVLLLGVYPRGAKPGDAKTDAYRANIKKVNELISTFDDGKTVKYLYFGDKFLAADGSIPKELMPDALHLSTAGYQIWVDSVNPVIAEMMK